jgi:hypothetical protein
MNGAIANLRAEKSARHHVAKRETCFEFAASGSSAIPAPSNSSAIIGSLMTGRDRLGLLRVFGFTVAYAQVG